ncbi:MAG: hypothetical protein KKG59_03615, partial [Nanoarchaeota archaeon]|nr:hypothetical protein [Nanoarchaeota archaeon]
RGERDKPATMMVNEWTGGVSDRVVVRDLQVLHRNPYSVGGDVVIQGYPANVGQIGPNTVVHMTVQRADSLGLAIGDRSPYHLIYTGLDSLLDTEVLSPVSKGDTLSINGLGYITERF